MINVSWGDAQAYVAWLSRKTGETCRLPSEAEWEYACRAGTTTAYALPSPDGSDEIAGEGLANCWGCGSAWDGQSTSPVDSFPANAWGLLDMHGNVWEWVEDCWADGPATPDDGQTPVGMDSDCRTRGVRGGSWNDHLDDAQCDSRFSYYTDLRDSYIGFRVVCVPQG